MHGITIDPVSHVISLPFVIYIHTIDLAVLTDHTTLSNAIIKRNSTTTYRLNYLKRHTTKKHLQPIFQSFFKNNCPTYTALLQSRSQFFNLPSLSFTVQLVPKWQVYTEYRVHDRLLHKSFSSVFLSHLGLFTNFHKKIVTYIYTVRSLICLNY